MVMENYIEGTQKETSTHKIVRKTRTNGYEFATPELGIFNISKREDLDKFMKRKKWTYNIIEKISRLS